MALEWLIDLLKEWVIDQGYLTNGFVDRGDPVAVDRALGDFIIDGGWHKWDLSAIVPAGAQGVALGVAFLPLFVSRTIEFRRNGNANTANRVYLASAVAGPLVGVDAICSIDENRLIEYRITPASFALVTVVIKNWWF